MNVCFTCDSRYLKALECALYSLLLNNNMIVKKVYIVKGDDFEESSLQIMSNNFGVEIIFLEFICGLDAPGRFSSTVFLRLYFDLILPDSVESILYLDCDLLVIGSLDQLYLDENTYLSAVLDCGDSYISSFKYKYNIEQYFNAGVMFMNLKKMRKDGIFIKARDKAELNFRYADQDMMNIAVDGKFTIIDDVYNHMGSIINRSAFIVHYAHCKPWEFFCWNDNSSKYFELENLLNTNTPRMKAIFSLKRILRNFVYRYFLSGKK